MLYLLLSSPYIFFPLPLRSEVVDICGRQVCCQEHLQNKSLVGVCSLVTPFSSCRQRPFSVKHSANLPFLLVYNSSLYSLRTQLFFHSSVAEESYPPARKMRGSPYHFPGKRWFPRLLPIYIFMRKPRQIPHLFSRGRQTQTIAN